MDDDAPIAGAMSNPGVANSVMPNSGTMHCEPHREPHREPPPSLGMVAHIWAGHLGPVEPDPGADTGAEQPARQPIEQ
jgi:hypothetical protein